MRGLCADKRYTIRAANHVVYLSLYGRRSRLTCVFWGGGGCPSSRTSTVVLPVAFPEVEQRSDQVDRYRKDKGRVILCGDFRQRLQIPELQGYRVSTHDIRRLSQTC